MAGPAPRKLVQRFAVHDVPAEVFSVRFSLDGALLATGCNDGAVRVYHGQTGALTATLTPSGSELLPVTALRWRPSGTASGGQLPSAQVAAAGGASKASSRHVLLACGADGMVRHWQVGTGKLLSKVAEPGNQIFAADYRADGYFFATGGKDRLIRLYDENTRSLVSTLVGGTPDVTPGHSNRVFSIKFHPNDGNVILSAGWDNTVQIYDIRAGHAVRSLFGPHVCGDALDVERVSGAILTGSWRAHDQLQLWDFDSGRDLATLPWLPLPSSGGPAPASGSGSGPPSSLTTTSSFPSLQRESSATTSSSNGATSSTKPQTSKGPARSATGPQHTMLYSAAFSKGDIVPGATTGSSYIAAGGSGANEVRVYDRSQAAKAFASGTPLDACPNPVLVGVVTGLSRGVFSTDWDGDSALAVAGGDGPIRVIELMPIGPTDIGFVGSSVGGGGAQAGGKLTLAALKRVVPSPQSAPSSSSGSSSTPASGTDTSAPSAYVLDFGTSASAGTASLWPQQLQPVTVAT